MVKMLTGRKLVRCSTLMRSFGLLIKVIHLTQQKGLYFEMNVGGDWSYCRGKIAFSDRDFLLYIRCPSIPLPKFSKLKRPCSCIYVYTRYIPSILDPFFSLQRFESTNFRPFYDSILNLPFISSSFISISKWILYVSMSFKCKLYA